MSHEGPELWAPKITERMLHDECDELMSSQGWIASMKGMRVGVEYGLQAKKEGRAGHHFDRIEQLSWMLRMGEMMDFDG